MLWQWLFGWERLWWAVCVSLCSDRSRVTQLFLQLQPFTSRNTRLEHEGLVELYFELQFLKVFTSFVSTLFELNGSVLSMCEHKGPGKELALQKMGLQEKSLEKKV